MTISRLGTHPDALSQLHLDGRPPGRVGHMHFEERALSRGLFVKRAAGLAGVALTSSLWLPAVGRARSKTTSAAPRPVPANPALGGLHINLPGEGNEPSAISDFNGFVGIAEIKGTGTATQADGAEQRLFFDVDNRFMRGEYVGLDGRLHHGTFAFT